MDKATQVMAVLLDRCIMYTLLKILDPFNGQALIRTTVLQEVVNAIVEGQCCGLGLAMNKISIGPNMPTISFITD
jgi:hypothetical protein